MSVLKKIRSQKILNWNQATSTNIKKHTIKDYSWFSALTPIQHQNQYLYNKYILVIVYCELVLKINPVNPILCIFKDIYPLSLHLPVSSSWIILTVTLLSSAQKMI